MSSFADKIHNASKKASENIKPNSSSDKPEWQKAQEAQQEKDKVNIADQVSKNEASKKGSTSNLPPYLTGNNSGSGPTTSGNLGNIVDNKITSEQNKKKEEAANKNKYPNWDPENGYKGPEPDKPLIDLGGELAMLAAGGKAMGGAINKAGNFAKWGKNNLHNTVKGGINSGAKRAIQQGAKEVAIDVAKAGLPGAVLTTNNVRNGSPAAAPVAQPISQPTSQPTMSRQPVPARAPAAKQPSVVKTNAPASAPAAPMPNAKGPATMGDGSTHRLGINLNPGSNVYRESPATATMAAPSGSTSPSPAGNNTPLPTEPYRPSADEVINGWQDSIGNGYSANGNYNLSAGAYGNVGNSSNGRQATTLSQNLRDNAIQSREGAGIDLMAAQIDPAKVLSQPGSNAIVNTKVGGETITSGIAPRSIYVEGGDADGRFGTEVPGHYEWDFDKGSSQGNWTDQGFANKTSSSLGLGNSNSGYTGDQWNQGMKKTPIATSDKEFKVFCKNCHRDPVLKAVVHKVAGRI